MRYSVEIDVGDQILTPFGVGMIRYVQRHGVEVETTNDPQRFIPWAELVIQTRDGDHFRAIDTALFPWWDQLLSLIHI